MHLSASTVMFNSLPVEEACARIAALGFEGVDFWQGEYFRCKHLDEVAGRLGAEGLRALLAKHRLKVAAFTCYLGIPHQQYAPILGMAGGGQGVLIRESEFFKRESGPGNEPPKNNHELMQRMRALFEAVKPALELAEKYGYRIAIENHTNALLNSIDSFKTFVELAGHPRLGIALAPYHLQIDRISVEDVIALAGKRIFFVYA
jgi:sugar phosphate isomerase/epimerase